MYVLILAFLTSPLYRFCFWISVPSWIDYLQAWYSTSSKEYPLNVWLDPEEPTPILYHQHLSRDRTTRNLCFHVIESKQPGTTPYVWEPKEGPFLEYLHKKQLSKYSLVRIQVRGSCNGLIYLSQDDRHVITSLVVIHPLRKECYELPPFLLCFENHMHRESYGLSFDAFTNTYKMVCVLLKEYAPPNKPDMVKKNLCTMVHVFGTNSWREIPQVPSYPIRGKAIFANGCLHWLVSHFDIKTEDGGREVIWFNVNKEEFGLIDPPKRMCKLWSWYGCYYDHLVDLNGKVGYVCCRAMEVWVSNKQKEWVPHCRFKEEIVPDGLFIEVIRCWSKGGDILIKCILRGNGRVISSRSEYRSIDATICKYLSGMAFSSLRTSYSSFMGFLKSVQDMDDCGIIVNQLMILMRVRILFLHESVVHLLRKECYELPPFPLRFDKSMRRESCGHGFDTSTVGRCYTEIKTEDGGRPVILFDVEKEEFWLIDPPKRMCDKYSCKYQVVDLNGEVGYMCTVTMEFLLLNHKKEWVPHCRFKEEIVHDGLFIDVIGCWNKEGDILIRSICGNPLYAFYVYNLKSGVLHKTNLAGSVGCPGGYLISVKCWTLVPKSGGSSGGSLPVEHSVVAQGYGLSTNHSHTPSVRPTVSTPSVRQLDASSDIRRLNELKQNVVDQDDHQVNLPSKKTCVCLSNSFPCIHQQSVNPVNVNTPSTPVDDHDDHGHNGLHVGAERIPFSERGSHHPVTSLDSHLTPTVNTNTSQRRNCESSAVNLSTSRQQLPALRGRVVLRTYQMYPEYMKLLLQDRHFLENIRAYNRMFSMKSLDAQDAQVDDSVNNGRGPYVFKISRQLYHWIGSLCPIEEQNKIDYVREHQNDIRSEYLSGIYDAINRGDSDGSDCGIRVILPQSFTGDLFYQRMLLCHKKGYKSFPGISIVNDIVYPTCRAACEALGILENDREWEIMLEESALTKTPVELRTLLAHILTFHQVSHPIKLRNRTWKRMSEDIPYTSSISLNIPNLHIDDSNLEHYVLYELENCLNHCSKSLADFGLRMPPERLMYVLKNKLLMEEKNYDRTLLPAHRDQLLPQLNDKHRHIFSLIMDACFNNRQELVFVYGHGGTGKTFLWRTFIFSFRFEGKTVLDVASSVTNLQDIDMKRVSIFAQWLLDIGNGKIGTPDECDPENCSWVDILEHYCIPDDGNGISNLINFIYDNETLRYPSAMKLQDKAIVCPMNDTTDIINNKILSLLPGRAYTYLSYDEAIPHGHDRGEVELFYPREYLNTLSFHGLPPHSCEQTGLWERTLVNSTSLIFGRFIQLEEVPGEDFLEHYFNFTSYNELAARADVKNAIFTHYIGRIQAVSRIHTSKDATSNRIHRRIIDIQNLSGNTISLALWHDMAINFNLQEYEALERPVFIAVSSCWVRRYHGLQLSSTSATRYYLNPNIPETFHMKQVHQQLPEPQVMINIENQRYKNPKEEKTKNRFPLATVFDLDPQNYEDGDDILAELSDKDQYKLSSALKELEGTTHVFQFHFDSGSSSRRRDLVLDRVFKTKILPLPASPLQVIPLDPIVKEQSRASQVPEPTAAPIREHQSEAIQHAKPLSLASATPASNQPEVVDEITSVNSSNYSRNCKTYQRRSTNQLTQYICHEVTLQN
nr:F-box domain-containing protein [Tanacetum cinerariifolium]